MKCWFVSIEMNTKSGFFSILPKDSEINIKRDEIKALEPLANPTNRIISFSFFIIFGKITLVRMQAENNSQLYSCEFFYTDINSFFIFFYFISFIYFYLYTFLLYDVNSLSYNY